MADKDREASHAILGLNDSDTRRSASPEGTPAPAPGAPQYVYVQAPPPVPASGGGKVLPWLVGVLLVISVINLVLVIMSRSQYSDALSKQADQLNLLTRRMDSGDELYAKLRGQFQVTSERLGLTQQELSRARSLAADIQKQQQAAVSQLNDAIAKKASAEDVNKVQADASAKIGGLSTDLAGTRKDLESTKSEFANALSGTKGELSGAIARTHDELVALAHKTDRDYFEFSLSRKRAQQKLGTVTIELLKTDTKRNTFTVSLNFDDKWTQRKDKAINEPVYFYVQGAASALELVVNKLGKDSIAGYMSAPKGFFANTPNVLAARPGT
jgi:predicted  nucleic acid-binding Zn-ribbon protein